jgi:hypothetical protein
MLLPSVLQVIRRCVDIVAEDDGASAAQDDDADVRDRTSSEVSDCHARSSSYQVRLKPKLHFQVCNRCS